ncbi:MAG: UDP-N-acetylmuramate--L-alanine ligase [Candidatus Brocadiia bacterium]
MATPLTSLNLNKGPVHFIGISGTGMSGLAHYLASSETKVSGSDLQLIPSIKHYLKKSGIKLFPNHRASNINSDCKLVIKSAAIPGSNPEIIRANKYRIPIIKYAQLLGLLMRRAGYGIAVSGAHGKTTTSSLMAHILHQAGKKPSFVIGGVPKDFQSSARPGRSPYFVVEACEYDRSFHQLPAIIRIVNNVEPDHLDYYSNFANVVKAFRQFCLMPPARLDDGYRSGGPADRLVIANIDSPGVRRCLKGLKIRVATFGSTARAEWHFKPLPGNNGFRVWHKRQLYGDFRLGIPGHHNFYNALACIIAADRLGIAKPVIRKALAGFSGVARRFDVIASGPAVRGRIIIDDYGHHPTEITSTLQTARAAYPGRRIFCVFQPHQYSRTRLFLDQFAQALQAADAVLVPPIYSARDNARERALISSADLVNAINKISPRARYFDNFADIAGYLKGNTIPGDVIITLGAGDVWEIGPMLKQELKKG